MPWRRLAFFDEVASLSDATPQPVSTLASPGTATEASRADHVHNIASNAVATANIQDAAVIPSKININANLAFNDNQALNLVLENSSTAAETGVAGKIFYTTIAEEGSVGVMVYVP